MGFARHSRIRAAGAGATVTAVHCGSFYSLGDPIPMPPAGTLPIEGAFFYWENVPALPAAAGIFVVASLLLTAVSRLRRSPQSSKMLRKRSQVTAFKGVFGP